MQINILLNNLGGELEGEGKTGWNGFISEKKKKNLKYSWVDKCILWMVILVSKTVGENKNVCTETESLWISKL